VAGAAVCDTPAVSGTPARFTLNDGQMLVVPNDQVSQIYELLWQLAPKPGAISMAALLRSMSREPARYGAPLDLTAAQSTVLREAVVLLHDDPS